MEKDELYYKVIGALIAGKTPNEVAVEFDVSPGKVIRWHVEYKRHKEDGTLEKLLNLSELAIFTATQAAGLPIEAAVGAIERVSGLQLLETATQACALSLVTRIQSLAMSIDYVSDLDTLADSLCKIQAAFFNSNKTQVNIQNNMTGPAQAYSAFLGDKPGETN